MESDLLISPPCFTPESSMVGGVDVGGLRIGLMVQNHLIKTMQGVPPQCFMNDRDVQEEAE